MDWKIIQVTLLLIEKNNVFSADIMHTDRDYTDNINLANQLLLQSVHYLDLTKIVIEAKRQLKF